MANTYHLWRNDYDAPPYMRFACDVVEDEMTEDGYRVIGSDPAVADAAFMARVAATLSTPTLVQDGVEVTEDGRTGIAEISDTAGPREPGYFDAAICQVPGAVIRAEGRAT